MRWKGEKIPCTDIFTQTKSTVSSLSFCLSIISQFSAAVPPFFDGEVCAILVDRTMIKEEETWE